MTRQKPSRNYPLKVEAAYGRIYVSGQMARAVAGRLPGAYHDEKSDIWHLSLTLETMRALKRAGGFTSEQLMRYCTPSILAWSHAAHRSEKRVSELHQSIADGHRIDLPWLDKRRDTPAPAPTTDREREQRYEGGAGWRWKYRAPFEHQKVMATAACSLDGVAFLCEMGTAKTRPAIEAAAHHMRSGTIEMVIVVCPANVMSVWQREVAQWSDLTPIVLDGNVRAREQTLMALANSRRKNCVVVINYEVLHRMKTTIMKVAGLLRLGFLPDEMHKLRNPSAKQTKAGMEIAAHSVWRLGLTGSPILNGIENIWSQWYVIDLGVAFGANFVQFRREFFADNTYTPHSLSPLDNTAGDVGMRIRRRGLRYRKIDCLDLPPKLFEIRHCEMTPAQKRAYDEMVAFLLVQLRDMETGETAVSSASIHLTMMLRLSQITSGFLPIESDDDDTPVAHIFEPNPKLALLEEIVQELVAQNQQFIVWARYKYDIETIADVVSRYVPVAKYYSKTKRADKVAAEAAFQEGRVRALVGHPASGGLGLTLTAASTTLYYSQDYNLEYRIQSEDRTHRPGAEHHSAITYLDLQCRGTIDEVIHHSLGSKLKTAEAVTELRAHLERIAA